MTRIFVLIYAIDDQHYARFCHPDEPASETPEHARVIFRLDAVEGQDLNALKASARKKARMNHGISNVIGLE